MKEDKHPHHGLAHDLVAIERQMRERRRLLRLFATTGLAALLPACGDDAGASTASTGAGASSATPASTVGGTCIADPEETAGPFPGDGTNTANGSISNVLTASGIVRSDIRSSFLTTGTTAAGTRVDLTITLVNVDNSCAPLAGYAIYLWHCDVNGDYSLYTVPAESYLRGVQVTNANGQATFTTIFPGCYPGRYPHMHFEVHASLASATSGRNALLTSQFAMPAAASNAIYADAALYPSSASRFARISTATDGVFSDNTASQIAQQTPAFSGSPAIGYTAAALVGIRV